MDSLHLSHNMRRKYKFVSFLLYDMMTGLDRKHPGIVILWSICRFWKNSYLRAGDEVIKIVVVSQDAVETTTRTRYRSSAFVPLIQQNKRWIGEENYWHVLELTYAIVMKSPRMTVKSTNATWGCLFCFFGTFVKTFL